MRIVGISGIESRNNQVWTQFRVAFQKRLPEATLFVEEVDVAKFYEFWRFNDLSRSLIEKYNDGETTLFVGHSMGGLVACRVAYEIAKSGTTKVPGVITVFTPHVFWLFPLLLGVPVDPGVPVVSFEASHDSLVR